LGNLGTESLQSSINKNIEYFLSTQLYFTSPPPPKEKTEEKKNTKWTSFSLLEVFRED